MTDDQPLIDTIADELDRAHITRPSSHVREAQNILAALRAAGYEIVKLPAQDYEDEEGVGFDDSYVSGGKIYTTSEGLSETELTPEWLLSVLLELANG